MLKLYIGNKNYSSWSMRPWVLLRQAGIPFEEVKVRFDSFDAGSQFKQTLAGLTPTGKVPRAGGRRPGDLGHAGDRRIPGRAISRTSNSGPRTRRRGPARAASAPRCTPASPRCAATARRTSRPSLPEVGALIWRDKPAVRADVARLVAMWDELLAQHGGPLLFGRFTIADAYFAPVCMRLKTYALPVPPAIAAYVERVAALAGRGGVDRAGARRAGLPRLRRALPPETLDCRPCRSTWWAARCATPCSA